MFNETTFREMLLPYFFPHQQHKFGRSTSGNAAPLNTFFHNMINRIPIGEGENYPWFFQNGPYVTQTCDLRTYLRLETCDSYVTHMLQTCDLRLIDMRSETKSSRLESGC